jgi:hypothetical protein
MNAIIPDTLEGALILSLIDFLLSFIVISFIGIVLAGFPLLNRVAAQVVKWRAPAKRVAPSAGPLPEAAAPPGIPPEHVAAIAAAVAAYSFSSRIVHIEPAHSDSAWISEGRRSLHLSHQPRGQPGH